MKQSITLKQQQGATLIVVLLVLLLIMVAGAMAVRQSRTDLQVATSDQINTALLQTADNANQKLEKVINANPEADGSHSAEYQALLESISGFIGYFYNRDDRMNDEVVYCQDGKPQNYRILSATVRRGDGGTLYNAGYCATSDAKMKYTSAREVMVGQVSILPASVVESAEVPLSGYSTGQDIAGKTSKNMKFDIYSTAAIPAYGNDPKVGSCFMGKTGKLGASDSVSECLQGKGIPQTTVYQQADISRVTTTTVCQNFGNSANSNTKVCEVSTN